MNDIEIITALNTDLWLKYASRTLATWSREPRIYWQHQETAVWRRWRSRNTDLHPEPDFQHTWQRFSHKVEAQCRHLLTTQARYVVWLDADVIELKRPDFCTLLPREGELCSYLGRGDLYHPETGLIIYDTEHPRLEEFVEELAAIYLRDRIFELAQWHDAWVWDHACRTLEIPRRDLGPGQPGEAFQQSPVRDCLVHLKGDRKQNCDQKTIEEMMKKPRSK